MPELPEVETTRRGITPHLEGQTIADVIVRQPKLRWDVPRNLKQLLTGQVITGVTRRAKYLLLTTGNGTLILHLGMSGSLRVTTPQTPPEKHDHVDIILGNGQCLRLRDPRRFGAVLWTSDDPNNHALLRQLGPEPLEADFNVDYLYTRSRKRKQSIKQLLMDSHIVVGVGNIYASEALFQAGIRPGIAAGRVSRHQIERLVQSIREVLKAAIHQGGTTLRDFTASDGKPGYFQQQLYVYGRAGESCRVCDTPIKLIKQGQRATYYCPHCQH
jgi:formamidopyrimidine-DNA glycosylase